MGTNIMINIFGTHPVTSMQMSIEKTIYNILFSITVSTNIIIYLFSISFLNNENPYHFHKKARIFVHITNSILCHVFVIITAFVIFQNLEIINNSS